jgi:N6-adenosine-specific RNA methylase IME4
MAAAADVTRVTGSKEKAAVAAVAGRGRVAHTSDTRTELAAMFPYAWHSLCHTVLRGVSKPYVAETPRGGKRDRKRRRRTAGNDIENAPGLCAWMSAVHRQWLRTQQLVQGSSLVRHGTLQAGDDGPSPPQEPSSAAAPLAIPAAGEGSPGDGWSLAQWTEFVDRLAAPLPVPLVVPSRSAAERGSAAPLLPECVTLSPGELFGKLVEHESGGGGHTAAAVTREACEKGGEQAAAAATAETAVPGQREEAESETVLRALGRRWLLPPRTRFLMAPLTRWSEVLLAAAAGGGDGSGGYRVITLDPPWSNKSAQRLSGQNSYPTASWDRLPSLPIQQLASPAGTLVAVWVTNKQKYWTWLVDVVFQAWGAEYITTWYWLKVTDSGVPVVPIDAKRERKPFEPLVIGCVHRGGGQGQQRCSRRRGGGGGGGGPWVPPSRPLSSPSLAAPPSQAQSVQSASSAEGGAPSTYYHLRDTMITTGTPGMTENCPMVSAMPIRMLLSRSRYATVDRAQRSCGGGGGVRLGPIPLQRVLVGTPMGHSMKPPLDWHLDECFTRCGQRQQGSPEGVASDGQQLITQAPVPAARVVVGEARGDRRCATAYSSPLGPSPALRLELFARGLRPGWTCVGNEVLAQQQIGGGQGLYCDSTTSK